MKSKEPKAINFYFYWFIIFVMIIVFTGCATGPPVHYSTFRIMKVQQTENGYWIYFRDRIGLYRSFQESKPDSIYPGKLVKMPKVYKINRSL